jgi:hypothetical protein
MSSTVEITDNIKKDFIKVLQLRKKIIELFENLSIKMNQFKKLYNNMIKTTSVSSVAGTSSYQHSLFGIDAFYFQHKLIELEYNNMETVYKTLDNRLYCDHYKLISMVKEYINTEIMFSCSDNLKVMISKEFPYYKQLETTKEYDISYTTEMQSIIIQAICEINAVLEKKEKDVSKNKKHSEKGININNLIHMKNYNNAIMRSKMNMFIQYLETFNNHHINYFTNLMNRASTVLQNVVDSIRVDSDSDNDGDKDVNSCTTEESSTLHNVSRADEDNFDSDAPSNDKMSK